MTIGDDLLLLAVGTGRRRPRIRSEHRLRIALRTSELAELCLACRIAFGPRRIEVLGPAPVEDRRLTGVLLGLGRTVPPPSFHDWLRRSPSSLTTEYFSRLEDQKALRCRRRRGADGRTHHEVLSVDVARRRAVLGRLDVLVRSAPQGPPDPRDLVLAVLVGVADIAPAAYPGIRGAAARRRLAALTSSESTLLAATQAGGPLGGGRAGAPPAPGFLPAGQLANELVSLYSDVTTGGHGLAHSLDSGGWSDSGGGGHSD
ncbi:GPP34 family phosphoprotein [Streptomyces sp. NPDC047973]|uniref:GOLPH3/VPS74 family protein n=1 Tax=Streptomyces sp. NPDC047973 TaxID=3155383 RepID=UPI003447A2AB